jgi:hypothetical protein
VLGPVCAGAVEDPPPGRPALIALHPLSIEHMFA